MGLSGRPGRYHKGNIDLVNGTGSTRSPNIWPFCVHFAAVVRQRGVLQRRREFRKQSENFIVLVGQFRALTSVNEVVAVDVEGFRTSDIRAEGYLFKR